MIITLLLILWFAYWGAESGASLPWSKLWQDKLSWLSELPEAIIAISTATIATWGWGTLLGLSPLASVGVFILSTVIAYAGKQSATWAYLNWTGHTKDKDGDGVITDADGRDSTLFGFNNLIGKLLGYRLGSEGYSWIWAATKGLIMTLPLAGAGAVFHPLGHELGSHAKGRLPGDPNMYKELSGGGIGIGVPASLFILVVLILIT
jgi:hypothetical protein